jgi:hypothetical protein
MKNPPEANESRIDGGFFDPVGMGVPPSAGWLISEIAEGLAGI